jgi:hypothetical protein
MKDNIHTAVMAQQLHRIANALEGIERKMKEPAEIRLLPLEKVQALNETSRALENSRGGTQL